MVRLRLIRRLLFRARQVDSRQRLLLAEAVVCLLAARFALLFLPFPHLGRQLGNFVPPTDPRVTRVTTGTSDEQKALAQDIGWAVTRAARYVPFRSVCLPQAMAARVMLNRRDVKSVMHFGAAMGREKPIDAHAWLDAVGVEVTGYPVAKHLSEIACFV